jgi:tripartite-type tricarboxylate transporter receptor subunit TctC
VSRPTRSTLLPLCFAACLWSGVTTAQTYPTKPLRIIVPLGPGGGVDQSSRLVGEKLGEAFNQRVVVDNRPGAGGTIATEAAARAAPDGYTLVMASPGHTITPHLYKLSFDAIRDFTPVTLILTVPFVVVVHPSLPVRNIKEFLALTRAHPNEILWSSSGNGSSQHLALELLKTMTGTRITHVPYKGTAPAMLDLVGGRVSVSAASIIATMPHFKSGRLRAIAVAGRTRTPAAPDLPTVSESGVPGYAIDVWHGLLAPAATPRAIVDRLNAETMKLLARADVKSRMATLGFDAIGDPPEKFAEYLQSETQKWGKVVREANLRLD